MKKGIEDRLKMLDSELNELFQTLDNENKEILALTPGNGGWNVLQVVEHLRMAEFHSFKYIRRKAESMDQIPKRNLKVKFRELGLRFFLNAPFKFKAPAIVNEESFPVDLNFEDQKKQWKDSRFGLHEWLKVQPDQYFRLQAYRHPMAGRMGIDGMLKFFQWHFRRHSKQIKRTLNDVKKQV